MELLQNVGRASDYPLQVSDCVKIVRDFYHNELSFHSRLRARGSLMEMLYAILGCELFLFQVTEQT